MRASNEQPLIETVLSQMLAVMTPNTRLAGSTAQYVNDATKLMTGTSPMPAILLSEGQQATARIGYRLWQTKLTIQGDYYDQWLQQTTVSVATVWQNIADDFRLMRSNLEDNPTVTVSGIRYVKGVVHFTQSPWEGQILTKQDTPFAFPVAMRSFQILVNLLPYISLA